MDVDYTLRQVSELIDKIVELEGQIRAITSQTERETLDQQLESVVAELEDWLESHVSMRQL